MTTVHDNLDLLLDDVIRAIEQCGRSTSWSEQEFLHLATRITRFQEKSPDLEVSGLASIPVTTTDVFRYSHVGPAGETARCKVEFRTSGTTARHRGVHRLARTDVYQASALRCSDLLLFRRYPTRQLISLIPRWEDAGDSSLSFMLDCFSRQRFPTSTSFAVRRGRIDTDRLTRAIDQATSSSTPVLFFTTTLAAAALLDTGIGAELPAGSVIVSTGGAKGRAKSVNSGSVADDLRRRLGAPHVSEYGMTELLSQAYQLDDDPFFLPPWCRVLAFDPETGRPLPHGRKGLLRFVDLANVQSAIAVQTADLGETVTPSSFFLHGRAVGAPLRGCSLTFEELAESRP